MNPDIYNKQFFPDPRPASRGVDRRDARAAGRGSDASRRPSSGWPRSTTPHPALSVFDDPDAHYLTGGAVLPPVPAEAWRAARGRPGRWRSSARGPRPWSRAASATACVVLAAFPANAAWTNLPLKPEFVPLILRLVSYVAHAPDLEVPSTVPADGAAEIAVAGTWAPASGKVDRRPRATPPR